MENQDDDLHGLAEAIRQRRSERPTLRRGAATLACVKRLACLPAWMCGFAAAYGCICDGGGRTAANASKNCYKGQRRCNRILSAHYSLRAS
jgi:hypothetical protein